MVFSFLSKRTHMLYLILSIQVFQKDKGDELWLGEYCSITCQRVGQVGRTTLKNKEIYIISFLVSVLVSTEVTGYFVYIAFIPFSIQRMIIDKIYYLFRRNNHSTSNQSGRRRSSFKSQSKQPMAVFF